MSDSHKNCFPFQESNSPALWLVNRGIAGAVHVARLDFPSENVVKDLSVRDLRIALALMETGREKLERELERKKAEGLV